MTHTSCKCGWSGDTEACHKVSETFGTVYYCPECLKERLAWVRYADIVNSKKKKETAKYIEQQNNDINDEQTFNNTHMPEPAKYITLNRGEILPCSRCGKPFDEHDAGVWYCKKCGEDRDKRFLVYKYGG